MCNKRIQYATVLAPLILVISTAVLSVKYTIHLNGFN